MPDPLKTPDDPPRYETSRPNTRAIFWFILAFALAGSVILPAVWWMERIYLRHPAIAMSPIAQPFDLQQPLQPSPAHPTLAWQDMAALRAAQTAQLNAFAPLPDPTHARIPIARAIDLLLQSGQLKQPWINPTTQPYQLESPPAPKSKPPVENRT